MTILKICTGSENPVKLKALEIVSTQFFSSSEIKITSINADSRVSEQPKSLEETLTGAVNRSINAFNSGLFQIGCGIESGIFREPHGRSFFNSTVCALFNGNKIYKGLGPGFKLPENLALMISEDGLELDEAVKKAGYTDNERIGYDKGLIGILSKNKIDRMTYTIPAVQMAFISYINEI
ncbi:MAG: hypothetical protein CSA18_02310 [Deltaproteobacteria bacterium]|nr:MAG: hypothetical protein CSB21_01155 [Deltaproteobacteria bacterium]PIE74964.1 MAG: hypothetical protein CSA18_02310 [Deltaproteobacteria bacterium]